MASYESIRTLTGTAGEDLTVYRMVTRAADGDFNPTGAGEWPSGICAESVGDTEYFPYVVADGGIAKVEAGAALATIGTEVASDASGKVIAAVTTAKVVGRTVSVSTADGDIIEVQFLGKPEDSSA